MRDQINHGNVYLLSCFIIPAALIRSTKLKGSWDNFKMFQKSGGAKQAKEDFRSLNPTNVETYGVKIMSCQTKNEG